MRLLFIGCVPGNNLYHTTMNAGNDNVNCVFVLGIMPRSGTHYLRNLLCLHPECAESVLPEDGLIARSNILMKYVTENYRGWEYVGDLPEIGAGELLAEELGRGLLAFLKKARCRAIERDTLPPAISRLKSDARYIVAKTPLVNNLKNFFSFFPGEKLLVLVRDGRDLVESRNLSFGVNRDESIREWATAARQIIKMKKKWEAEGRHFMIVKYEDLYQNTEAEMKNILGFLDLDAGKFDFHKALSAPVVGSSVFKRNGGEVHWHPVEKTPDFNPMTRSAGWTRWQHERFNWLASNELALFGYEPVKFKQGNLLIILRNHVCDFLYAMRLWTRRFRKLTYFIVKRLKLYFNNSNKRDT